MPDISDPTTIHTPEPDPLGPTVVRPTPAAPSSALPGATDETLVRTSAAAPPSVTSGSSGFAEETRQLLRKRLLVTHSAIGIAMSFVVLLHGSGAPVLPCDRGLGHWALGLPLIMLGQSAV